MKICHVITRMIVGGAQENTLLTVEGLDRLGGYNTTLITGPALGPEGSLIERARTNKVDLMVLESMRRAIHPLRDWLVYRELVNLFRREAPEIVHTHSSKAGILGRLAAHAARVPVIIHTVHGSPFHAYQNAAANQLFIRLERRAPPRKRMRGSSGFTPSGLPGPRFDLRQSCSRTRNWSCRSQLRRSNLDANRRAIITRLEPPISRECRRLWGLTAIRPQ